MAYTLKPEIVQRSKNYLIWKLYVKSDGNALTATDIFSETYMPRDMKPKLQGIPMMVVKADPLAANQPDQAWDFTIYDRDGDAVLTVTDTSHTAATYHDMSTDIGMYPVFTDVMKIAFPTAADWTSGDTVELVFTCWLEPSAR